MVLAFKPQAQQRVGIRQKVNRAQRTLVSRLHGLGVKRFHAWIWFVGWRIQWHAGMIRTLGEAIGPNRTCVYRGAVGWAEISIDLLGRGLDRESLVLAQASQERTASESENSALYKKLAQHGSPLGHGWLAMGAYAQALPANCRHSSPNGTASIAGLSAKLSTPG